MTKKQFLMLGFLFLIFLIYPLRAFPQQKDDTRVVAVPMKLMDDIEDNLDKVSKSIKNLENSNKELSKKIEILLQNQQNIIQQLETIKYRTYR